MSYVIINPEKVFQSILEAAICRENELRLVEQQVVAEHRQWWNAWMHKGFSDEEILVESLSKGVLRMEIEKEIVKLNALARMCSHAIQEYVSISLSREDYELIYEKE